MKHSRFLTASEEEINELKKLVKQVDQSKPPLSADSSVNHTLPGPRLNNNISNGQAATIQATKGLFNGGIQNVDVTREPLNIPNPVIWIKMLMPELKPHKWQFEELMRLAGYLDHNDFSQRWDITDLQPFKPVYSAANGSGKDMVIIAGFATWFSVVGCRNRTIITSSSFEQTKFQTEPHIREFCQRANSRFGPLFRWTQFHYVVPELGSEIKLFATDEAKRAEGYHPFPGGRMAIIINEAKSVEPAIFDALSRCTGYSYWIEISSPGRRSGHMYNAASSAVAYPNPALTGQYYFRRIPASECSHIPQTHIDAMIYERGENDPWVRSSIFAEFSDYNEPVIITEWAFDKCNLNPVAQQGTDIGIGLDLAGGGDEDACFVRQGNRVIHSFFFRQADTDLAADLIDKQLSPWKTLDYVFRADNGGIGQAIIDQLVKRKWRIRRTNNQSPAFNKREYLNLGAELWFYVKRLIERRDIAIPQGIDKLKQQLTTRYYRGFDSTQGKLALESKAEAKANGHPSPDRADAFVLCFSTYRPNRPVIEDTKKPRHLVTMEELIKLAHRGMMRPPAGYLAAPGRFTMMDGKI